MNHRRSKIDFHYREYAIILAFVVFVIVVLPISSSLGDQSNVEKMAMKISSVALIVSLMALVGNVIPGILDERHNRSERYFYYTQLLFSHRQNFRHQTIEKAHESEELIEKPGDLQSLFFKTFKFQTHCIQHFQVIMNITESLGERPLRRHETESILLIIKSNYDFDELLPFFEGCKKVSINLAQDESIELAEKKKYKKHSKHLDVLIDYLEKSINI